MRMTEREVSSLLIFPVPKTMGLATRALASTELGRLGNAQQQRSLVKFPRRSAFMAASFHSSDGDAMEHAALTAVVVDRAMLNQAIVPNRKRARLPHETRMQFRVLQRAE